MSIFSSKPKRQVGIDIGTSSIKAVELSGEGSHLELLNYGVIDGLDFFSQLPDHTNIPSTLKMSENDIAVVLKKLLEFSKIRTKEAVLSIPIFSSFLTVINIPSMNQKQLEKAVPFQARSHIPVPLSEVVMDWVVVPPRVGGQKVESPGSMSQEKKHSKNISITSTEEDLKRVDATTLSQEGGELTKKIEVQKTHPDKISVLLVAVPKEVITKYQRVAEKSQLRVGALESESFSLMRSLVGNDPTPIMLIDFGARSTTLTVVDQNFVRMSHTVDLSGKEITKAISRGLNVSLSRAEELKKASGLASDGVEKGISQLITPLLGRVVGEFQKMFNMYIQKEGQKISRVILSGGPANLPGLIPYLSKELSVDVTIGDPFARVKYPEKLKPIMEKGLATNLAVSAGLAMRDL